MPLLPASIGIVLNQTETEVLLVKRKDVPIWILPGGGIEENESPETSLLREIKEETGYHVRILRKCAEYSPMNRLASETHVFICKVVEGDATLSNETGAVEFHPISKLPAPFFLPHAIWLKEAMSRSETVRRPLTEISYPALIYYFFRHPWQVLRFAWTRFFGG